MDYFSILPLEILEMILKPLSNRQKLVCKAVNKKWRALINNFKFEKLAISGDEFHKASWFHNYDPIEDLITFDSKKFSMFDVLRHNEHHFVRLKKLHLNCQKKTGEKIDYSLGDLINSLVNLDQLELHGVYKTDEAMTIRLESLNTLSINGCHFKMLELDTHNLTNIRLISEWYSNLTIKYPKNIKTLYIDKINSSDFEAYSNLEYLYIVHIYSGFWDLLVELPHLKELHFESSSTWSTYDNAMNSKRETKNEIFKPYMFGIYFEEPNYQLDVDSYRANRRNVELFKEYSNSLADYLVFFDSLDYNGFEDVFDDEIPSSLINKFVNVSKIIIHGKVKKENQLIKFLGHFSNLVTSLSFESTNLTQHFFNKLPELISILDYLSIKSEKNEFDFHFLTNFKSIKTVELDQNVQSEILEMICLKFGRTLEYVSCREGNRKTVRIVRDSKKELKFYKVDIKRDFTSKTASIASLHLNSLFGSNSSLESLEIDSLF